MVSRAVSSLLADARMHLVTGESVAPVHNSSRPSRHHDFPALAPSHVHEWHPAHDFPGNAWYPPLTLLTMLALSVNPEGRVLWIGRRCWPAFQLLCSLPIQETPQARLRRSTFLDPLTDAERFWAIGQGLRCAGVGCVVADGSGMPVTVSRRLQLAAETGRAVGIIARPPWEIDEPSYATTRWRVQARESHTNSPQWEIEQLRCRGRRPGQNP